ncbi:NAD(P)H-binding protein [Pseudomonas syringae group genomosp. 3]|uniref:NmrA family NAD(P)-binding protein n=1 Tax=Pseudomonas syringae group genomosp. 3 TaxID=251701 RepID=UPI0016055060|nr:NAD(P)H-binding protein [Pseudomonas syringae group genomosp. 3]
MNNPARPTILITGAAGRLGHKAVQHLLSLGLVNVVAGSRDPAKLGDLEALGAEVRRVDFEDRESLVQAFSGIDRLLLVSTNEIHQPGKRLSQHLAAVAVAAQAGVQHIAYTSIMNPGPESAIVFADDHRETERAIVATGLRFTFLRNSFYQENVLIDAPSIQAGRLYTAAGEGNASYVSIADCARAAAASIGRGISGCFDITGPDGLSTSQLMSAISRATGKSVEVVQLDDVNMAKQCSSIGLPDRIVQVIISHEVAKRLNLFSQVTDSVRVLTGREPEPFSTFLANPHNVAALLNPASFG